MITRWCSALAALWKRVVLGLAKRWRWGKHQSFHPSNSKNTSTSRSRWSCQVTYHLRDEQIFLSRRLASSRSFPFAAQEYGPFPTARFCTQTVSLISQAPGQWDSMIPPGRFPAVSAGYGTFPDKGVVNYRVSARKISNLTGICGVRQPLGTQTDTLLATTDKSALQRAQKSAEPCKRWRDTSSQANAHRKISHLTA